MKNWKDVFFFPWSCRKKFCSEWTNALHLVSFIWYHRHFSRARSHKKYTYIYNDILTSFFSLLRPNPKKNMGLCMGPKSNARVDHNHTLCGMPTPEWTPTHLPWATLCQSRLYLPVRDLGVGLSILSWWSGICPGAGQFPIIKDDILLHLFGSNFCVRRIHILTLSEYIWDSILFNKFWYTGYSTQYSII